ncbi:MAG: MFS superfamily sulfate permease-like transporter [Bacteroidia bacterium]
MNDGSGQALNYVLAAIVISGAIQVVLGFFKLGRLADVFHPSVIHGILAAIGIIIFAKQINIAFGTTTEATQAIAIILDFTRNLSNINPFVAIISVSGLLLMIFHSKISYKLFHFLPAPFWVLVLSIPFVYAFNFFEPHVLHIFNKAYAVGPSLLVDIPDSFMDALAYPNFSKINTLPFWLSVLSITMIASIETLASAKAVDKLDPYKRRTDLNKDLVGVGLSTMVSGLVGGLPIITVIVRSTVNVHNNAKTKWSNLYHGIIILIFIFFLAPVIQQVPLSALAIILVYTGYKLTSPRVFKHVFDQGIEQLIFFVGTLLITLLTNLLFGILGGMLLVLLVHILVARLPVSIFFKNIFKSGTKLELQKNGDYHLKIKGVSNFLSVLSLDKLYNKIPLDANVNVNVSEASLVDATVLESIYDFERRLESKSGSMKIIGAVVMLLRRIINWL